MAFSTKLGIISVAFLITIAPSTAIPKKLILLIADMSNRTNDIVHTVTIQGSDNFPLLGTNDQTAAEWNTKLIGNLTVDMNISVEFEEMCNNLLKNLAKESRVAFVTDCLDLEAVVAVPAIDEPGWYRAHIGKPSIVPSSGSNISYNTEIVIFEKLVFFVPVEDTEEIFFSEIGVAAFRENLGVFLPNVAGDLTRANGVQLQATPNFNYEAHCQVGKKIAVQYDKELNGKPDPHGDWIFYDILEKPDLSFKVKRFIVKEAVSADSVIIED